MTLRWEEQYPGTWWAYSNRLIIGMCGQRADGTVWYQVDAVRTKWVTKGRGEVKSIRAAKRSIQRAWRVWLGEAGLS
jgi:hypothetical protein